MKTPATRLRAKAATGFDGTLILFSIFMSQILFESVVHRGELHLKQVTNPLGDFCLDGPSPQDMFCTSAFVSKFRFSVRFSPILVFLGVLWQAKQVERKASDTNAGRESC